MRKYLLLLFSFFVCLTVTAQSNLSSMGTDFWTGMGFNTRMQDIDDAENVPLMSLFLSAQQTTTVRVSLQFPAPANGFPAPCNCKTVNIPAGQAVEVTNFPMGDMADEYNETLAPDSRLYFTATTNRAIHIESLSGVPIAAYQYTYGKDVGGATVLFPTATWGSTYIVSTKGGGTNAGLPNSFFFVMAQEDSTWVDIIPTEGIMDSSNNTVFNSNATGAANIKYQKGVPFSVLLYKGQVFNAMGALLSGRVGLDLTGTTIRARDCGKKITVFSGNGRVSIPAQANCSASPASSDNLIVQLFPKSAWGTKYLTTPTTSTNAKYNLFRIIVADPTTKVWVNNPSHTTALTGLVNNYYELRTDLPSMIESDKPIMITQFMTSIIAGCDMGNTTPDEPEMIIISPVQQALNNVSVFSPRKSRFLTNPSSTHYINVVIRKEGVASFQFDGSATFNGVAISTLFKPHPQDANYSYAYFTPIAVGTAGLTHNLKSDSGFNAIAYGLTQGETYGYNAGTAIKDLSAIIQTNNPFKSVSGGRSCKGNPSTLEIAVPYLASQINNIKWDFGTDSRVSPTGAFNVANPTPIRTFISNDITYNVYKAPQTVTFSAPDTFKILVTISGTFVSECGSTQVIPIDMIVVDYNSDFSFSNSSCASKDITFKDETIPATGTTITQWEWDFGDNSPVSTVQNPPVHTYPDFLPYLVKLHTINDIGCFSDKDSTIDFAAGVKANFTTAPKDTICAGGTITFKNTSTSTGGAGPITQWTWNFGEGADVVATTGADQTHTYSAPGKFNVKLTVNTQNGCQNTYIKEVVIEATPIAAFDPPTAACLGTEITFTDKSTIAVGTIAGWVWDFGDGQASVAQNPKHTYVNAGAYTVTLKVTSAGGCASANTASHTFSISALPTADFTISPDCNTKVVTFTDNSVPNSGTITKWVWHFDDGSADETKTSGAPFPHTYTNGSGQTFNPSLVVTTDRGCSNIVPLVKSFGIGASPTALFTLPTGNFCLPDAALTFQNTSSITDGTLLTYVWNYGDNSVPDTLLPAAPGPQSHTFNITGPTVTLTAISDKGCKNVFSLPVTTIYGQPVAKIDITSPVASTEVCLGSSFTFSANGSTAVNSAVTSWSWTFGDPAGSTSTDKSPSQTYTAAGPYTVALTVTSDKACVSTTIDTVVTVNQLPIADFIAIGAPCAGGSISFDDKSDPVVPGATLTNWSWDFGNGTQQLTTPGATQPYPVAGTFTVSLVVKNSKGCSSSPTAHDVVVNPLPEPDFDTTYFCAPVGATIQFTATNNNAAVVSLYEWDFGTTPVSTGVGQQVTNLYTAGQNYTVTLKATTDNQCIASTSKQVPVYDIPTPYLTVADGDKLCSNIPVVITNLTSLNGFGSVSKIDIYWDKNDPTVPVQTENAPASGTSYPHSYEVFGSPVTKAVPVSLVAYNPAGCTATYDTIISLLAAPDAQLVLQPAAVCQEVEPYILTGGSDVSGLPGSGWYSGEGVSENDSLTFSPEEAGVGSHTITYTFTNAGCTDTASMELVVHPTPIVDYGNVKSVLEGDSSKIKPISVNTTGLSYEWTPGLYLSDPTIVDPVTKPKADQLYNILVNSEAGCTSTSILLVRMLKDFVVPNTFSPNGDGINDTWVIEHLDVYPNHRLQVFNRYGQLLYQSRTYDNNKAWDGTFKGSPLPWGTYYYILELDEWREPKTGYVTLLK